jgi:hypothetical protein
VKTSTNTPSGRPGLCFGGVHFWARDGYNNCDCGFITVGPWNLPKRWTPGTVVVTALCRAAVLVGSGVEQKDTEARG